jgi:hypothetical protein
MRRARSRLACSTFQGDKANQYQFKATALITFSRCFNLLAMNINVYQHMPTTKTSLKKLCPLRSKFWDEAFLLYIPEKSGSKLGRETGYPERDFSVLQTKL